MSTQHEITLLIELQVDFRPIATLQHKAITTSVHTNSENHYIQ